jgi:hypothetical protein
MKQTSAPSRWRAPRYSFPLRGVIRVTLTVRRSLPAYPDKQTFSVSVGMSPRCQQETHALHQKKHEIQHRSGNVGVHELRGGLRRLLEG